MSDLLTTLHPINDDTTDLYPNVKRDNLPQNVKAELDAIPNKVDKVQGKGLSTNDFTNEDKALVDTIPDKVNKEQGKGLSTNDYTNADKALVDTIPDKVNREQGKGLSTNDYTNADKNAVEVAIPLKISFLDTNILDLYRMVIRSGGMITVTDAGVALTSQTFPLTVSQKALLNYVGGMCKKCENLYDKTQVPVTGTIYKCRLEAGTYTISLRIKTAGKNAYVSLYKSGQSSPILQVGFVGNYNTSSSYTGIASSTFTLTEAADSMAFYNSANGVDVDQIMLVKGSTAKPYEPYFEGIKIAPVTTVVSKGSTNIYYPIHQSIRALDGYGYGLSADCYNYIDFERKKFVQMVARVDLGTLNFAYNSVDGVYSSSDLSALIKVPASQNTVSEAKAEKYGMTYQNNITNAEIGTMCIVANGTLFIRANEGDIISGYFYYPLKEPVETDISDLLRYTFPTYDIINVLPSGYLEFENENNIGVPYSVTYQSKPDAQTTVQTIAPTAISEVDSNDPTNSL